jgi:hypothetical protein
MDLESIYNAIKISSPDVYKFFSISERILIYKGNDNLTISKSDYDYRNKCCNTSNKIHIIKIWY